MPRHFLFVCVLIWGCAANPAIFLTENSTVDGVTIQPKDALEIAAPHLQEHGTVVWKSEENLRTHIIRKGRYYFIKRSDFPAKSAHWYLNGCIRIDSQSGEMTFLE